MNDDRFDKLFRKHLRRAEASGIRPPVVALLSPRSSCARAAHADYAARPLRVGRGDYLSKHGLMVTWPAATAARLLRRHGGLGGRAAANLLDEPPSPELDYWVLGMHEDELRLFAAVRDALPLSSAVFYDRLPYELCACCADKKDVCLMARLGGGKQVLVHGPTAADAAKTECLLRIVAERRLPSLRRGSAQSREVGLPVKDAELEAVLRDFFADAPQMVAQVIRTLRAARVRGCGWLTRTLESRPELRLLADRVRGELAGRAADPLGDSD